MNSAGLPVFPADSLKRLLPLAFEEDEGAGDITSLATIPAGSRSRARFLAKEEGVAAGLDAVGVVFAWRGFAVALQRRAREGQAIGPGDALLTAEGETRALLVCERIALNFLQRLCGVATAARRHADALAGSATRLLDTRKTLPGYRALDKYAVRVGGGLNHRRGLFDRVLVKDNHVRACGGVRQAVERVRGTYGARYEVEAEVTSLEQLETLLDAGVDTILLDNMEDEELGRAVEMVRARAPRIRLEASGRMDLERLRRIKDIGLDFVSVGSITHSVRALDISLEFD